MIVIDGDCQGWLEEEDKAPIIEYIGTPMIGRVDDRYRCYTSQFLDYH